MTDTSATAEHFIALGSISAHLTSTGALRHFDVDGLSLVQYPASELEPGLGGLWVRRLVSDGGAEPQPLTGPASGATVRTDAVGATIRGSATGLSWTLRLAPAASASAWFWHLAVRNDSAERITLDAVWAADVALTPDEVVRINQYYVAQYLDLTPVDTERGPALAVRQNMPRDRQPWVLVGGLTPTAGWATDALQLRGPAAGLPALAGLGRAALPSSRLQHEHTLATLATAPTELAPGDIWRTGFYGLVRPHHPDATRPADAAHAAAALALPEAADPGLDVAGAAPAPSASLFVTAPALELVDLSPADLAPLTGPGTRRLECGPDGWWAYVTDAGEAVTSPRKEQRVLRPHGHILRTGVALTPDSGVLTSTVYLAGLFASQVTQGNVASDPVVTGRRTYLGLQRAHGLRAFVDEGDGWRLLAEPSAWGLLPDRARWWYATPRGLLLEVSAEAGEEDVLSVRFATLDGQAPRLLIAAHLSAAAELGSGRAEVRTGAGAATLTWTGDARPGDDASLFLDGGSRGLPWLTLDAAGDVDLQLTADLVATEHAVAATEFLPDVAGATVRLSADGALASEIDALDATLPWFAQNALVHYLSPRGLEQFTGGAWGTRDVCQGPVGLLLSLDEPAALRAVILGIMAGQNERGDWPQAFDFLPPQSYFEQFTAHGDVILWPLLATGEYLLTTGDATVLDADAPFVAEAAPAAPPASVREHLARALTLVEDRTVPGSALPAYGHGDWNDSLQPADPLLAERMASTWTAVLEVHALRTLADGLTAADADAALAARCRSRADAVAIEIRRHLLADGLLAGYGVFGDDSGTPSELLVHPRDRHTGLTYGVLPWIHAITADLLSPAEARHHLDALAAHLLGPDGARLFDRPTGYRGGPLRVFKRAEAGTFWGREIGLLYTHAHLRYAEALARVGDGPGLLEALLLAAPFGLTDRLPAARPRQSTCYYSSSDGAFVDRYDAADRYADLMAGRVPLEGGWRVYSSGPGLFLRLVVQSLLGLRRRGNRVEVDPVIDPRLSGLVADVPLAGRRVSFRFEVAGSPGVQVRSGGRPVPGVPLANRYRAPGVSVAIADLADRVDVTVGGARPDAGSAASASGW